MCRCTVLGLRAITQLELFIYISVSQTVSRWLSITNFHVYFSVSRPKKFWKHWYYIYNWIDKKSLIYGNFILTSCWLISGDDQSKQKLPNVEWIDKIIKRILQFMFLSNLNLLDRLQLMHCMILSIFKFWKITDNGGYLNHVPYRVVILIVSL